MKALHLALSPRVKRLGVTLVVTFALLSRFSASAAMLLSVNDSFPNVLWADVQETIGFQFRVNEPIVVDGLGVFDDWQDGLVNFAEVGLWDSSKNLLALPVIIPAGAAAPLDNWFRWMPLVGGPITLQPGTYTVGARTEFMQEQYLGYQWSGVSVVPQAVFLEGRYFSNVQPLTYPEFTLPFSISGYGFFGGNVHLRTGTPQISVTDTNGNPLTTLSFSDQTVPPGSSVSKGILVTNSGTADLRIDSISITGDAEGNFPSVTVYGNPTFPVTIPVGASPLPVAVKFEPQSLGQKSATLAISHNTAQPNPFTVALSGGQNLDIITNVLNWNVTQGGLDFRYTVNNGPLATATTAKLFWANGTTKTNIIPGAPVIFTQNIPVGASGLSAVIPVPAANFANPPATATHVLLVLDPDNLIPNEADEGNNVMALAIQDIVAVALAWNNTKGGVDLRYRVDGGAISSATTAKVFWASGTTRGDILSPTPIFPQDIPSGTGGAGSTGVQSVNVPGILLRNPPAGTTHLLLVVNPDGVVQEANQNNNVVALADAHISFDPKANQAVVSDYTRGVIKDAQRFAGQAGVYITRTASTTYDQARIMFEVLEGPVTKAMRDKDFTTTLAYSYALYDTNGVKVIDKYVESKAAGKPAAQIIGDMQAVIDNIKLTNPDAFRHTANPARLQVVDIAPNSPILIVNKPLFQRATDPTTDSRIRRRLGPNTVPADIAFHIEVPQPGALSPVLAASTATGDEPQLAKVQYAPTVQAVRSGGFKPPPPDCFLVLVTNRFAIGAGSVSIGHVAFCFHADAGDILTVGVSVNSFEPGTTYTNDDSVLFLLDESGLLLGSNDDVDPFDTGFQSLISGYALNRAGTYYAVVGTFANRPLLDTNNVVVAWQDNGGANIQFDLLVSLLPSQFGLRRLDGSLVALEWGTNGVLQETTSLPGGWSDIPFATTPYILAPTNPQKFYRLRIP